MDKAIQRVVIVGGGPAGWMCAAALSRLIKHAGIHITLVESDDIGAVGVGEATIPSIRTFNALLGLNEDDFIRETQATFKLGIEFKDWDRIGAAYFHPFGTTGLDLNGIKYHQFWLKSALSSAHGAEAGAFDQHSLSAVAARMNRFTRPVDNQSILSTLRYAFHFDAGLYARYLRKYSEGRGVIRIEGQIDTVALRPTDGFIGSVSISGRPPISGDLFIDCSGFRALLIGNALKVPYCDWSAMLPCNRALAVPSEASDTLSPYTRATADLAGWRWQIPLKSRTGNGYVYASDFISDAEARDSLLVHLDSEPLAEPRAIRFTTGRRQNFWVKNCVSLGLATGFIEPLESTSIHLIQTGISRLLGLFPGSNFSSVEIEQYNREVITEFEQIRDFVVFHYKATRRDDTAFWRYCRDMPIPDSLKHRIELFKVRGHIPYDANHLFTSDSWLAVMLGQGLIPEGYDPLVDSVDSGEAYRFVRHVKTTIEETALSLPLHSSYLASLSKFDQMNRDACVNGNRKI